MANNGRKQTYSNDDLMQGNAAYNIAVEKAPA